MCLVWSKCLGCKTQYEVDHKSPFFWTHHIVQVINGLLLLSEGGPGH